MLQFTVILLILNVLSKECYCQHPFGPVIQATKGEVWPLPKRQVKFDYFLHVSKKDFKFEIINKSCSILENSLKYYSRLIFETIYELDVFIPSNKKLKSLKVNLKSACLDQDYPYLEMDEKYVLEITKKKACLEANSIWGILRGLESFSQLLYPNQNNTLLNLQHTVIHDQPRFPHRGLLLDTSRHYIPPRIIFKILEAMAFNKMNVFHWHIVDDPSFPYESQAFPNLSKVGAYAPWLTYPHSLIKEIIEYARLKGIRVIPEFDTPAHTSSWLGEPEILTTCPENNQYIIDPTLEETYTFLGKFFKDVDDLFPDKYIHIGGDEVNPKCWALNPKIRDFMKAKKIKRYNLLHHYYMERLIDILNTKNVTKIVWEDAYLNSAPLSKSTIIQIWKSNQFRWSDPLAGQTRLKEVVLNGFPSILSSCWYLDHINRGNDWDHLYNCDPHNIQVPKEVKKLILGGEACMWTEYADVTNVVSRIWPRASAVAEKLWSVKNAGSISDVLGRIEEHTCRMIRRRIAAEPPNGPGFCPFKIDNITFF